MEAKDTVMTDEQIVELVGLISINYRKIAQAQAEVSFGAGQSGRREQCEKRINELQETCNQWERLSADFKKAGIREVVEWLNNNDWGRAQKQNWQAKLKEWNVLESRSSGNQS